MSQRCEAATQYRNYGVQDATKHSTHETNGEDDLVKQRRVLEQISPIRMLRGQTVELPLQNGLFLLIGRHIHDRLMLVDVRVPFEGGGVYYLVGKENAPNI